MLRLSVVLAIQTAILGHTKACDLCLTYTRAPFLCTGQELDDGATAVPTRRSAQLSSRGPTQLCYEVDFISTSNSELYAFTVVYTCLPKPTAFGRLNHSRAACFTSPY